MKRRDVLTTGSVLLIGAISGCLSIFDDEPPDPHAGEEVPVSQFSFPDGFEEDGIDDEVWRNPGGYLDGIESLTVTHEQEFEVSEGLFERISVNRASRTQERAETEVSATFAEETMLWQSYDTEQHRIRRTEWPDSEVTYDHSSFPFSFELASDYTAIGQVLLGRSFTVDRVTEVGGERFAFYHWVGGDRNPPGPFGGTIEVVSEVSLEVIIDETGFIHEIDGSWDFEDEHGEPGYATIRYETSDIDDTTVDEPDWLEEALDELGLGDIGDELTPSTPSYIDIPSAAFSVDEDPERFTVTFTHAGGESIDRSTLSVRGEAFADVEHLGIGEFTVGDELVVHIFPDASTRGTELRLEWAHPDLDETRTLRTHTFRHEFDPSVDED